MRVRPEPLAKGLGRHGSGLRSNTLQQPNYIQMPRTVLRGGVRTSLSMASPQRQSRTYALREHAKGHIAKYKEELNILLDHPIGYQGEILNVMMDNLEQIARYEEHLAMLDKHFKE